MENLINSLEDNLKELYRKAVDADNQINELKKQGHGKFTSIFPDQKLFEINANKFMPYLEHTAEQILKLKESNATAEESQQEIEAIVKKLHLLHTTLAEFKAALK